jgi:hypothetical protein
MTSLENRVQKTAKANGINNYNEISFSELFRVQNLYMDIYKDSINKFGVAMKNELWEKANDLIVDNNIPMMPQGHAIISEARKELSLMFTETSNSYK